MSEYKIELGVQLNTADIKSQLSKITDNTHRIRIDIDNSRFLKQTEQIKRELRSLGKNNKTLLALDTNRLETSLKDVKTIITDIRAALGTLNSGGDMKPLLSSINQISAALDNASGKFDELNAELKTLSSKDFNINLDINMGKSFNNIAYGREARKKILPELKSQVEYLEDMLGGKSAVIKQLSRQDRNFDMFSYFDGLTSGSMIKRMEAYEDYVNRLIRVANATNVNLDGFYSSFSKTPTELIDSVTGLNKSADVAEESMQKLKQAFGGSGINADGLTVQLDSIVSDLGEIRTAVQGLSSSGISLDGLTSSFDKLSNSIELLVKNCANMKTAINDSVGGLGGSVDVAGSGFEGVENDLKQVAVAAKNSADAIGYVQKALSAEGIKDASSIENVAKELNESFKEINAVSTKFSDKNNVLTLSVKGINEVGEAITVIKEFDVTSDGILSNGKTIAQSFDTSADAAKRWKKEVSNAYQDLKSTNKQIGKLEIDLIGAKAKNDIREIERITLKLAELRTKAADIKDVYGKHFTTRHNNLLNDLDSKIEDDKLKAQNKIAVQLDTDKVKAETREVEESFKRLKILANEMGQLDIKIAGLDVDKDANEIRDLTNLVNRLESEYNELYVATKKSLDGGQVKELDKIFVNTTNKVRELKKELANMSIARANNIKYDMGIGDFDNNMSKMYDDFNKLSQVSDELYRSVSLVENAYREMEIAINTNTGDEVADAKRLIAIQEKYASALERTNNLIRIQTREERTKARFDKAEQSAESLKLDMASWLKENSRAAKEYGNEIKRLTSLLDDFAKVGDQVKINDIGRQLNNIKKDAKAKDKTGLTLFDQVKTKFKEYSAYFSVAEAFMYAEQALRSMFDTVVEIDTAMTGLRRVTDLTGAQYDILFDDMIASAKEYGATLTDVINATTDWVRAGFDADTALGLAEVTTMYQHISDLDYDTAAENLITAYNGFKDELLGLYDGDEVAAVSYIADIFNELDNNFAVTSAGLGEALKRSASALDLAGNSIQETAG